MVASFSDLGLSETTLKAISELGYEEPTPVQEQTIRLMLEGSDVIAQAQTGTGKTAAFALPILQNLGCGYREAVVSGNTIWRKIRTIRVGIVLTHISASTRACGRIRIEMHEERCIRNA